MDPQMQMITMMTLNLWFLPTNSVDGHNLVSYWDLGIVAQGKVVRAMIWMAKGESPYNHFSKIPNAVIIN